MAAQEVGGPAEVRMSLPEEEARGVSVVMVMMDAAPPSTTSPTIPIQVAEGLDRPEVPAQDSLSIPEPEVMVAPVGTGSEQVDTSGSGIDKINDGASVRAAEPTAAGATTSEFADATNEFTKLSTPKSTPGSPALSHAGGADDFQHLPPERASSASRFAALASPPVASKQLLEAQHGSKMLEEVSAAEDQPSETTAGKAPANAAVTEAAESINLKELPKVATVAALHAGQAYAAAGVDAQNTIKALWSLREKEGPPVTLSVDQVATVLFLALVGLQLLFIPIFMPSTFRLLYSILCGLLFGLGLSYMFFFNVKKKSERNKLLGINLGLKGVQLVAAGLPPMFAISDTEKVEWLNRLVEEVWPFFDKGVCEMIKETTAQVMPGILATLPSPLGSLVKSIGFKHLTFGGAPMRVESIWVSPDQTENLVMEVSVKWCGDPNITLAIEIATGQKLCPRVMDISFVATIRLVLGPLVPRLPGFVAAMATMPKTPMIKYRLDFGKALGGSIAPASVTPVIDYFMRDIIDRMLVWPARVVVSILQTTPQDMVEVSRLLRRHRGVLRVTVVRGKELKGLGASDKACVTLTTDSEHYESTSEKSSFNLSEGLPHPPNIKEIRVAPAGPVNWNETLYLLVQEPDSQMLRLEAFDTTAFSSGVVRIGRRLIGRALVKLSKVCKAGAQGSQDLMAMRVQLGSNDWGSPGGPGKGMGKLQLRVTYFPCESFTQEQVLASKKGIVTVRFLLIRGLTPLANNVTFYASVNTLAAKKADKPSWKSGRKTWTLTAHNNVLVAKAKQLELEAERDEREDRGEYAAKKRAKAIELRQRVSATDGVAPLVTIDYRLDSSSMHAFYNVVDTVPETGEENAVIIKVIREGRGIKSANEVVGVAHIPISTLRNSYSLNPLSGNMEHGLIVHMNDTVMQSDPMLADTQDDTGIQLDGCSTARMHMILRYVPCLEVDPASLPDDDDDDEARKEATTTTTLLPNPSQIEAVLPMPHGKASALLPSALRDQKAAEPQASEAQPAPPDV